MPRRLENPYRELPEGQHVPFLDVTGREIQHAGLVGIDHRVIHLEQGPDAVYMSVVCVGDQDRPDIQLVAFHCLKKRRVKSAGIYQDRVPAAVRPDKVRIGEPRAGKKGKEPHASGSRNVASLILEVRKSTAVRWTSSKVARVRLQSFMLTSSMKEP